jgi:hypothetical protein
MHPADESVIGFVAKSIATTDRPPDATQDYPQSSLSAQGFCLW